MDKERLFRYLEQKYISKYEMSGNIPLGINPDELWEEILKNRLAKSVVLPLKNICGKNYWYILTNKMIAASENIVEELMENNSDKTPRSVSTLEETFFTGYMEGAQISIQDAMTFLQSGEEPHNIEELMILNNRQAGSFAAENIYHTVDENYLRNLAYILTNGLDNGGGDFRLTNCIEIPSMQGEKFELPNAADIPELVHEFTDFLADPKIHPLIKSAAAQAWILAIRPFPEGNERLARLLSSVILIRAGYTFFSEISLSSLIARSSYNYFNAIANILRIENGADLTYFIEYYLVLLSSAVNELKSRRTLKQQEINEAEKRLAQIPFTNNNVIECTENVSKTAIDNAETKENIIQMLKRFAEKKSGSRSEGAKTLLEFIENGKFQMTSADLADAMGIRKKIAQYILRCFNAENILYVADVTKTKKLYCFSFARKSENETLRESEGVNRIRNYLKDTIDHSRSQRQTEIAELLLKYLSRCRTEFSSYDLISNLNISQKSANNILRLLQNNRIIEFVRRENRYNVYEFCFDSAESTAYEKDTPAAELPEYSQEISDLVLKLQSSGSSLKDKRLGKILQSCLKKGFVTVEDYKAIGESSKMTSDMNFAKQLELVERVSAGHYKIRHDLDTSHSQMEDTMKNTLSALYDIFGDDAFSVEMVIAKLAYSSSHVSTCLHQFTWLKILDCKKNEDRTFTYQFLVNPKDNPECFSAA